MLKAILSLMLNFTEVCSAYRSALGGRVCLMMSYVLHMKTVTAFRFGFDVLVIVFAWIT